MKKLILFIIVILNSGLLLATQQQPDILNYSGKKLSLSTGWAYPSPLETYFQQKDISYPFKVLSTGNYRGHIATWDIIDNKLFLSEIAIQNKTFNPKEFNVQSKSDSVSNNEKVFADWFTGVIVGEDRNNEGNEKIRNTFYFYVKYGVVVDIQEINRKDLDNIRALLSKEKELTEDLEDKFSMLLLNENYIAYYFRLSDDDTIVIDDKGGYLSGNSGLSPVLLYFNNDHVKWPFNWENSEKNGAPFCTWHIENDSLKLTHIELHTGTGFYETEKYTLEISEVFPDKPLIEVIFANWVSGIFYIRHGKEVENESLSGYFEFKETEYTFMRIKGGIIEEKYNVPSDFDFKNISNNTEEGLKKILEELNRK